MSPAPLAKLADGHAIPQLGLGTWPVGDAEVENLLVDAIGMGYRLFDTAARYDNEEGVGRALRRAEVPRHELFVTTKLGGTDHGYDAALAGFEESRRRLGVEHVDLFLIHWPLPLQDRYVDTWRAFVQLQRDGLATSIGVSNFAPAHIERIVEATGVWPAVNQVEMHPDFAQARLRAWHTQHGVTTMSWGPLRSRSRVLADPVVTSIAARVARSAAQVVLRWHVQLGCVPIPKSSTPARMRENLDVFDFSLTADDMAALAALDNGSRLGGDPDTHLELW